MMGRAVACRFNPWRGSGRSWSSPQVWLLALGLSAFAGRAEAQVDAQRFKPALTYDGWLGAEGSAVRHPDDRWEFGLFANYGINSLIAVDAQGNLQRQFVAGRLGFDAQASASLTRRLALGVGLPVYVLQSGDGAPSSAGIGDLRLAPKLEVLSDLRDGFGLALLGEVRLPTHGGDFSGGKRSLEFEPKVALDHRFASGVRIGFNLGVVLRSTAQFINVKAGDELAYAAALGYRFGGQSGRTEIGVELDGGFGLAKLDREELPLEALGFIRHALGHEWELIGGPGVGVLEGYGVPTFRVFVGVRFTPTSHDRDFDGISDAEDECPEDPEDRDGVLDADGCPDEELDSDHDGVPDSRDKCPGAKETINGIDDDDGCPDSGDRRVIYEDGHFSVLDAIRFQSGSAEISSESDSLLDQVALTLKANPEIEHVRIDGHTDDTGPRAFNLQLSEERARAVRHYLIQRGVSPRRLRVRSYGPDRPVEEGTDERARARNRRVEFVLE